METKELISLLQALKEPNNKLSEKAEYLKEKAIDVLTKRLEGESNNHDNSGSHANNEEEEKDDLPF